MQKYKILWADDEIDLLKPHTLFLEKKGYEMVTVNSGADAIEQVENQPFDLIFLDENMPGMTGLETLDYIKSSKPNIPVVMITKSEEEMIMEQAIGAKISDYLIKPLNPNQILLSIKKILDNRRLVTEKTNMSYQQDFRNLSMAYSDDIDHREWIEIYRKLTFWELEIDNTEDRSMSEVLDNQKDEANSNFARFITDNYDLWLNEVGVDKPLLSHELMTKRIFPELKTDQPLFFILIDNLRFDQWKIIEPIIADHYTVEEESSMYSILPTTTAFSRNAIFSGMLPAEMAKYHSDIWVGDDQEEGKNNHEYEFLKRQLKKNRLDIKSSYHKIIRTEQGKQLLDNVSNLMKNDLNVVVYNFVDMLSHARTDMEMIRELAPDEAAYRSITKSWFLHSPLLDLFKWLSRESVKVIVATDHGTIRVKRPAKIIGDRNTNTNLRYKQGKNLNFDNNRVFAVRRPEDLHLPRLNVSTTYAFATQDYFFAYPNNYNYYVNYYRDTFQHGGVSLEEMIVPLITLTPKNA
ncbi:bifunctional response regulator/alkaline phosphatase family protein [Tunicatimonas pelagia]|uniref:T9SS response regulator signal transducer PorX n=1 Tax=Tunicatimonas pelagia TaxID=931531 RepID=UPI002665C023|nr:bifunctional response regulator/alkaline phosphatase family protein [Tunicatimonas pelagia]WKN41523.1 bifunctional response regulator/alkaline phosphatase family protein [Tunicatimonas pelagia]